MDEEELQNLVDMYKKAQIGEPGKAFARNMVDQAGGIAQLVGHYGNSQFANDLADKIYQYSDSLKPQGREETEAEQVAGFAGNYAPSMAIALASRSPAAGIAFDTLQETGNTIRNLKDGGVQGENLNKGANETFLGNTLSGIATYGLGKVGAGAFSKGIKPNSIQESKNKVAEKIAQVLGFGVDDAMQNVANEVALSKYSPMMNRR